MIVSMFLISTRKKPVDGGMCGLSESKKYYVIDIDSGETKQYLGSSIIKSISSGQFINARGTLGFMAMSLKTARDNMGSISIRNNANISITANLNGAYNASHKLYFNFSIKVLNSCTVFYFNDFVFPVYIKSNNSVTNIPNSVFSFMGADLSIEGLWTASVVDFQSLEFNFSHIKVSSDSVAFALILSCDDVRDKQFVRVGKVELTKYSISIDDLSGKAVTINSVLKRVLTNYDNPNNYTFNKFSCLSNYYLCNVIYNGLQYKSSEAAYQSMKTLDLDLRCKFINLSPDGAKNLGRQIESSQYLRNDWESVKYGIMKEIVLAKMQQNPSIASFLMSINSESIVEDTTGWHDNIWGRCSCEKCKDVKSLNYLGKILVEVRTILRGY